MFQHEPVVKINEVRNIIAWGGKRKEKRKEGREEDRKEKRKRGGQ